VPGVARKYKLAALIMYTNEVVYYLAEFLTSSEISVCTVHILNIRSGAPITCFRNVNPPELCSGIRSVAKWLNNSLIVTTAVTGHPREDVLITRIPTISLEYSFTFRWICFQWELALQNV
jgi:hypothetical protein